MKVARTFTYCVCDIVLEDVFSLVVFSFFLLLSQCFIITITTVGIYYFNSRYKSVRITITQTVQMIGFNAIAPTFALCSFVS